MRRPPRLDRRRLDTRMGRWRFRKPCVILNPRAASGKAARRWPELRPLIETALGPVDVSFTQAPNHASELARHAIRDGSELVVAVGGDGTFNEVLNGYLADGIPVNPASSLALCPLGTGGDFRRSAGIPTLPHDAVEAIASAPTRRIDACRVQLSKADGSSVERFFVNVTSFGMGGEVSVAAKNCWLTPVNGRAAFLWATVLTFLRYRAKPVRLTLDGAMADSDVRVMQVAFGNGLYQGGGMNVCPLARLDSGSIDVTVIEEISLLNFLMSLRLLYSDKIYTHPKAHHYRVREAFATSPESVLAEVDGEAVGGLPFAAEVLPGAVSLAGAAVPA